MDEPSKHLGEIRMTLQRSAEMRMRAIQERISTTEIFTRTIEVEIGFGALDRARDHLANLHSMLDKLTTHIDDPAHVSDNVLKQQFLKRLTEIEQRISSLESQINYAIQRDGFC